MKPKTQHLTAKGIEPPLKDLGNMSRWKKEPEQVTKCRKAKHKLIVYQNGEGNNEFVCPLCRIKFHTGVVR